MSRVVLILILLTLPLYAHAQEEDLFADEFELLAEEDIVMAAAKHKQKIGFSPSAVIVITRKDIEESGAVNLVDLLRRHSTIYVYSITSAFPQIHARGNARILVLLDGREMNLELLPQPFFHLRQNGSYELNPFPLYVVTRGRCDPFAAPVFPVLYGFIYEILQELHGPGMPMQPVHQSRPVRD